MYSIDDVVLSLKQAGEPKRGQNLSLKLISKFEGEFRKKIEKRAEKMKAKNQYIKFKKLNYVGAYEIGNFTGNEVLRIFTNVLRNKELCSKGNCILFSVESTYCVAFVFLTTNIIEAITPPPPSEMEECKYVFIKLFDDDIVNEERKDNGDLYAEDKIRNLRLEAKLQFPQFLKLKLKNFPSLPFRQSFLGVLFEIGRPMRPSLCQSQPIPTAACVKLALDMLDTGRLNRVFGAMNSERASTVEETGETSRQQVQQKTPIDEKKKKLSSECRAYVGINAAKEILKRAIPSTKNGMFLEDDLKKVIAEVKEFYQIEE